MRTTRSRIVLVTAGLLALAAIGSVVLLRQVLLARLAEDVDLQLRQEADEFSALVAQSGFEEAGAEVDVADVIRTFLSRNVPESDEVLVGLVDGGVLARTPEPPLRIEEDLDLVDGWWSELAPTFRTDPSAAGDVRSLVVPVLSDDDRVATFVVANFVQFDRDDVDEIVTAAAQVLAVAVVIAAVLAWIVAGRVLRPLRVLADTASSIDEGDFDRRVPVPGTTDLAALAETLNGMLDRIERAYVSQRQFLDDAAHELRTPLTIMRGHLELARDDEPLDAQTRSIVMDEIDRMARLVDDLLVLATARRPDFVVLEPVDVRDLADAVADRAWALGDRRWHRDIDVDEVVSLDQQRVTQAWMNFVRNAVQHTDPGNDITIFARRSGAELHLGVSDSGDGLDPADVERILSRFGRGASGRRDRTDGIGLGLAIAGVIADAHGGSLHVDPGPGTGASFWLAVPASTPELPADPGAVTP
ncbi:MAG: HAMP domain-containing sensor histidine kinase [Actinomycetota bacterium]